MKDAGKTERDRSVQRNGAEEPLAGTLTLPAQDSRLLPQAFGNLPFPAALFGEGGAVVATSPLLLRQAEITEGDVRSGKVNLLDRVTDENCAVFEAAEDALLGGTTIVRDMVCPLALFGPNASPAADPYRTAIFFSVPRPDGSRYGAVVLMP